MKTAIAVSIGIFFTVALTSCMPSRGWQVNFGVSPVSAIDNNQQFAAPDTKAATLRKARY